MSAAEPTPDPWSEQEGERWRRTLHIGELLDGLPDEITEGNRALLTAALRLVWDSIPPHLRDMDRRPALAWAPNPGDPQYEQRRRLAAEAQHLLGMVNRRATMDELHRVAGRCVAICEGEDVGVLAEVARFRPRRRLAVRPA